MLIFTDIVSGFVWSLSTFCLLSFDNSFFLKLLFYFVWFGLISLLFLSTFCFFLPHLLWLLSDSACICFDFGLFFFKFGVDFARILSALLSDFYLPGRSRFLSIFVMIFSILCLLLSIFIRVLIILADFKKLLMIFNRFFLIFPDFLEMFSACSIHFCQCSVEFTRLILMMFFVNSNWLWSIFCQF